MKDFNEVAQSWLNGDFDPETKCKIIELRNNDPAGFEDAFYKNLEFGTGGLRGIMGVGTNRMNKYTVGMATQGLANYILKHLGLTNAPGIYWRKGCIIVCCETCLNWYVCVRERQT